MKNFLKFYGLTGLFFVALALLVFRCAWGGDQVFSGSDCNIGLIASAHRRLPELFTGAYNATAVFGNAGSAPLSFFNVGRWLLPPSVFGDIWYGLCLVCSSLCFVAYLRLWKLKWVSCLFGALAAFWVGSVTLASAGHLGKLGVMMMFTLALFLAEKAIRCKGHLSRVCCSIGAGLAIGFMLLEQQDVALFAGIFFGPYVLFRLIQTSAKKFMVWAELLMPIAVIGLLMAAPTALKAYQQNVTEVGMQQSSDAQWEFITQWSMVPAELPDLIAPGYKGWSTGNPEGPYWGSIGQSADWESTKQGFQNFRLDSLYLGVLPICFAFFGIYSAIRKRSEERELSAAIFCWAGLAVIALLLSFGKFSPLYKMFYQLPLVGNIRAPIKLLHNFQVMNAIVAAYGLDQFLKREWKWKSMTIALGVVAVLFGFFAASVDVSRFSAWGQYAIAISHTLRLAWVHALGMVLVLILVVFLREKSGKYGLAVCAALLVGASVADSLLLTHHYFKAENIAQLKQGNTVLNYLKENQGNERIFFLDQSGVYNRWLAVEGSYYGLNFFNIWQMPRMPEDIKNFLSAAGKNQVRLWQLASVKYITAPAGVLAQLTEPLKSQLTPVMFYRFVRQGEGVGTQRIQKPEGKQDQVLLKFNATVPRFALFHQWKSVPLEEQCSMLFSPRFDPRQTVLVESGMDESSAGGMNAFSPVEVSVRQDDAVLKTSADKAGIVLFTQRYQPVWRVTVDGEDAPLLRCNYLCMGVAVPAGTHDIRFYCDGGR